jgi:hypothetical protein
MNNAQKIIAFDNTACVRADDTLVLGTQAIVISVESDSYILDNQYRAQRAVSCLILPQIGDRVLVTEHPTLVLAILQREPGQQAELSVPDACALHLNQATISLRASEKLALHSLRDAELTAATGTLHLAARNLFTTVLETLVERAADKLAKVGSYALDVSNLLRLRSSHSIITADKQIRIDAEQVHLG